MTDNSHTTKTTLTVSNKDNYGFEISEAKSVDDVI